MDEIIQIEILTEMINMLFAKSVAFKDDNMITELNILRKQICYGNFDYNSIIKRLKELEKELQQYD